MPIQLKPPIYETYILKEIDEKYGVEGDSTFVTIRQATQAQVEQREKFFAKQERKIAPQEHPGEVRIIQDITEAELKKLEVWLTLIESNIEDENGKALFPSKKDSNGNSRLAMNITQFNAAWGQLPEDVAEAIHSKVLELNMMWAGPEGEGN